MNTRELRLNNYVTINNKTHRPEETGAILRVISIDWRSVGLSDEDDNTFGQLNKFIKPIRISEKILKKLGFEEIGKDHYGVARFEKDGFEIERGIKSRTYWCSHIKVPGEGQKDFKYLHTLQNWYLEVMDKELKF